MVALETRGALDQSLGSLQKGSNKGLPNSNFDLKYRGMG